MSLLFYILLAMLAIYAGFLMWMAAGFLKTRSFESDENISAKKITIIVCARNEEKTIARCLKTIVQQNYPADKMQIMVINDASEDRTLLQAQAALKDCGIDYKIFSNKEQKGKKKSITYAMQFIQHPLIVTRDADTYTPSYSWLQSISDFHTQNPCDLIIGPVSIADNSGTLWAIQAIENNVLCVLNAGSAYYGRPFLCNGANLAFTKEIFERVKGYNSHVEIASGDDVLFMEDIKKIPGAKINFLKSTEALVATYPCFSFASLLQQKIRWASKFSINPNPLNRTLAVLSFLINSAWLFCLFYGFLVPEKGTLSLIFVIFKLIIDILLLFLASGFIKNRGLVWYVLPTGLIYPVYTMIVALSSVFIKPRWK
jgi:cellulose synthase/poly-beta-1,6-N-acetylglucosamine synthase-like glycosyltransferase